MVSSTVMISNDCAVLKDAVSAFLAHIKSTCTRFTTGCTAYTLVKMPDASKYNTKVIMHGSHCHFGVSNGLKKLVYNGLAMSSGSDDGI